MTAEDITTAANALLDELAHLKDRYATLTDGRNADDDLTARDILTDWYGDTEPADEDYPLLRDPRRAIGALIEANATICYGLGGGDAIYSAFRDDLRDTCERAGLLWLEPEWCDECECGTAAVVGDDHAPYCSLHPGNVLR